MSLFDRHILREWFSILGLVLGAMLGLLLMQAMYDDFRDLLELDASVAEIARYFAIKLPSFLSIVLSLSLLLSLLYALGQLHRNNELTAMRAAGAGLFRITRSLWVAGALLCGLVWFLNANVVPWSVEESRRMWDNLKYRQEAKGGATVDRVGSRNTVAFDNQREGRMWFINRYSQFSRRGYGVMIEELDAQRHTKTRLTARQAWRDEAKGYWIFQDGRESWFDPETGEEMRTVSFAEKAVPHFREDPELMWIFDAKPTDLSFNELARIIAHFNVEENPKVNAYATRYYGLIADTLVPLIVIAIAIPFTVSGVRVNPAVGVSKSIGLFLAYFVLAKLSTSLGGRDILPPIWAAVIPNLAMLGIGLGFFSRVR